MDSSISSYHAYMDRYYAALEAKNSSHHPLGPDQFQFLYDQLAEGYQLYDDYIQMGEFETARNYFQNVIERLESQLVLREKENY